MGDSEEFGVRASILLRSLDSPLFLRSRWLLGAVVATNLGQKPKLGGVRSLSLFHCIIRFICFDLFEVFFTRSSLFLSLQKQQKDFLFLFSLLCFQSSARVRDDIYLYFLSSIVQVTRQ